MTIDDDELLLSLYCDSTCTFSDPRVGHVEVQMPRCVWEELCRRFEDIPEEAP